MMAENNNTSIQGLRAWAQIDLDALASNAQAVRQFIGPRPVLYGVVKANAYGCGSAECAKYLLDNGVDRLAVTFVSEGVKLRQAGIAAPILVMGPTMVNEMDELIRYDLTPSVSTADTVIQLADKLKQYGRTGFPIHLKVETGLGRTGVFPADAGNLADTILHYDELVLEGAFTHLSTAATGNPSLVHHQVSSFMEAVKNMETAGLNVPIKHVANSAATLAYPQYHFDAVRVGTLLYGQHPVSALADRLPLKEVWGLKTRVAHLATLPPNHGVGYGRAFTTRRETKIAVLPIGYVDGFQLEPIALPVGIWDLIKVLLKTAAAYFGFGPTARRINIGGKTAPVVGKVAMQFTMVDVTSLIDIQVGDIVDLPARRTVVAAHVPRVYIGEDRLRKGMEGRVK